MGSRPKKSYIDHIRRQMRKCLETGDSPSNKEPHWQRIGSKRHFNEHLSPLRRYLRKHVGRPWNKVHSEICAHINPSNVVQNHILTHLYQYVERHVVEVNGKIESRNGTPISYWSLFYVCPRTGLLRLTYRPANWREQYAVHYGSAVTELKIEAVQVVDPYHLCLKIHGVCKMVEVRPLPPLEYRLKSKQRDILLDRPVANLTEDVLRKHYGRPVYAITCRLLSMKELKQYPIPQTFSS